MHRSQGSQTHRQQAQRCRCRRLRRACCAGLQASPAQSGRRPRAPSCSNVLCRRHLHHSQALPAPCRGKGPGGSAVGRQSVAPALAELLGCRKGRKLARKHVETVSWGSRATRKHVAIAVGCVRASPPAATRTFVRCRRRRIEEEDQRAEAVVEADLANRAVGHERSRELAVQQDLHLVHTSEAALRRGECALAQRRKEAGLRRGRRLLACAQRLEAVPKASRHSWRHHKWGCILPLRKTWRRARRSRRDERQERDEEDGGPEGVLEATSTCPLVSRRHRCRGEISTRIQKDRQPTKVRAFTQLNFCSRSY